MPLRPLIAMVTLAWLLTAVGCSTLPGRMETTIQPPREGTVLLYSRSGCPFCHQAKQFLTARGAAVEERDISTDAVARQELASLYASRLKGEKQMVPVILLGSRIVIGFDQEELEEALDLWRSPPERETAHER